jgi:hypothetical protein
MKRHPWRTGNMSDAQLAVIPIPFDAMAIGVCNMKFSDMILEMMSILGRSNIFPRVRHVVIVNHWKTTKYHRDIASRLWPSGILPGMEGRGQCRTSLAYTSNYASLKMKPPTPSRPAHERRYSVNMIGQVDSRKGYQDRMALFTSSGFIPDAYIATSDAFGIFRRDHKRRKKDRKFLRSLSRCQSTTDRDRCLVTKPQILDRRQASQVMENSNFTLCLRGDTLGSDRWINAMVAGTALIAVANSRAELKWLPFPKVVPWHEIVIVIPRSKFHEDPARALREVIQATPAHRLQRLQNLSRHYAADLDWSSTNSRTLENMLREAVNIPCGGTHMRHHKHNETEHRNNSDSVQDRRHTGSKTAF